MNDRQLTLGLAALGQPRRMRIMRELVAGGHPVGGLHAGEVARIVGRTHSGTAMHLKELERAGLVGSANNGHATFFQPDGAALRDFVDALEAALGLRAGAAPAAPPAAGLGRAG